MGNCCSPETKFGLGKNQEDEDPDTVNKTGNQSDEKHSPQIFALISYGHEVIRGGLKDIEQFVHAKDIDGALISFQKLGKWENIFYIMKMGAGSNDGPHGLFNILDESFGGLVSEFELREGHDQISKYGDNVDDAFEAKSISLLKDSFDKFKHFNETHLKKEDNLIMPKIMDMKMSGVNLAELMANEILPLVSGNDDFMFFVQYANMILEKYEGNMSRARVFDHALSACASPEQWKIWKSWIKDAVTPERFEEIVAITG